MKKNKASCPRKSNPVHKNMLKFHKGSIHTDKKNDYSRNDKHRQDLKALSEQ